jgi:hypothetical protein
VRPPTVGEYDATTGATVSFPFITVGTITSNSVINGMVLDSLNHVFITDYRNSTVGEYDATTGAAINTAFIGYIGDPGSIVYVAPVPEPSSLLMLAGAAAIGVGMWRRRKVAVVQTGE